MKKYRFIALSLLLALILTIPMGDLAPAKVYIDINAPGFRRFPVAVPDFVDLTGRGRSVDISREARDILTDDLFMAGIFEVLNPSLYTPSPDRNNDLSKTNYSTWRKLGAEAVIKGGYTISGDSLAVEIRLFDTVNNRFIFGRRYTGSRDDLSRMIHKFADDLMVEFTGERGIFQSMIAFVTDLHGKKEIYIMDIDGKNKLRLTNNKAIDLSPSWSPDGSKVVYCSFKERRPKIFTINLKTFTDYMVAGFEGINISPAYSPRGGMIAFTSSKDYDPNLYMIGEGGGGLQRLTNGPNIDVSPSWSPDGSMIAFTSNRGGGPQIYVMNIATGKSKRLTFSGSYNTSPDWSPLGDKIAYVGSYRGRFEVYVIDVDGTGNTRLTGGGGDNEDPSWSPDGRFITFSSTRDGRGRIYWMRADGSDQTKIPGAGGNDSSPSWSPRVNF